MSNETPSRLLLTAREAAAELSISQRTLFSWTAPRGPLPVVRLNRALRYSRTDLEEFIIAQKERGPAE